MSKLLQRNRITIELSPNNYYVQMPKAGRDAADLQQVTIAPMQIRKVEIFKSYDKHLTDVIVDIDNLDPTIASLWGENKYIALLSIHALNHGEAGVGFENYFACYNMDINETPITPISYTGVPVVSARVILKSITRTRLEAENNFTFELGGKNGGGAAGAGQYPLQFLRGDLQEIYNRNYMEEGQEAIIPWDMTYTDEDESIHQIHSTPSNGYKIIVDTNLQTLEFFFKHYPLFNTTYDWMLDDCNTSPGSVATSLRISDFVWWPSWEPQINKNLSNIFNKEIDGGGVTGDNLFITMATLRYGGMQQLEHKPFRDWVVFFIKYGYPKIWAVDVSSGKPIPMNGWNAVHEEAPVLTPSGQIKLIKNPRYNEYLTFMTPKEIEETELYLGVHQNLQPTLEKYSFGNAFVGDVDIHTIVEFKLNKVEERRKFDRLGMGYQVLHTYLRDDLQPKNFTGASSTANDSSEVDSQFAYTHSLRTEIIFLVIDKGELNIPEVGNEDTVNVSASPSDYTYNPTDNCAGATDTGGGTPGGTDGKGIPGNSSISEQGLALFNHGFPYLWAGKTSLTQGIDCSGFTSMAVKNAGVGGYAHGTWGQRSWCKRNAAKIDKVENAQAGDIVFFDTGRSNRFGHTGIAISSTEFIHSSGGSKNTAGNLGRGATKTSFARYRYTTEIYRIKGH